MAQFISLADLVSAKHKHQDYISVKEAAAVNKISPTMVYWLIKKNRIKGISKLGNQYAIPSRWRYRQSREGRKHDPVKRPMLALNNPDPLHSLAKQDDII